MHELKRRNILRIAENKPENLPILHGLESFHASDSMFEYCVRFGIIGESFYNLSQENRFSPMRVGVYLLKKMESDKFKTLTGADLRS